MSLHLVKLCVGADTMQALSEWAQNERAAAACAGRVWRHEHVTRQAPRRSEELLKGGSLYWVMAGFILCRQRLLALEPRKGEDGIERCALVLDDEILRVRPSARRPFQGWRYLEGSAAPPDLEAGALPPSDDGLPPPLRRALSEFGVL